MTTEVGGAMARRAALAAAAAATILAAPRRGARAQPAPGRRWRITYGNLNDEVPFAAAVTRSLREAAGRRGDVDLTVLDNRGDPVRSVENARTVATARPDLFLQYNSNAAVNVQVGRIVGEAGVKMLAIQTSIPGAPIFAVDNTAAGTASGDLLSRTAKERWGEAGAAPVCVVINIPESGPLFLERGNGAKGAISARWPGIRFEEFSSRNDSGLTRQTATDILTRHPRAKVMLWAHVDAIALACVAAVRNAGREADCLITTTGGDRAAFPEIRRPGSPLLGTYSFFPETWGEDLIELSVKVLRGEPIPERTGPRRAEMITAANIDRLYPPA